MSKKFDIIAAGAVVLRHDPDPQVLLVHRPRYDDWSLPKGKIERNENTAVCAVREVAEETGVRIRLRVPLDAHEYPVKSQTKQVHWWLADVVDDSKLAPMDPDEVDQVGWFSIDEALNRLNYADERDRLNQALEQPSTTGLVIVRHAKALHRKSWDGNDPERPLTDWGRRQSRALIPLLTAFGVRRVVSSSAVRCLQTVTPFTRAAGLSLEGWHELTEESAEENPDAVTAAMLQLTEETLSSGVPVAVCGHRPVLPGMLDAIGMPDRKFATAEIRVAQLTADQQVHSVDQLTLRIR